MENLKEKRAEYMSKCKHLSPYEQCYKNSGYSGGFHINMGCNGKCTRMNKWDKKNNYENR